jgi:succinate dehydrogenase/fumarate reductase flavoprotein subunit
VSYKEAATRLAETMMRYVNLVKDEEMLRRAVEELAKLEESFNGLTAKDPHNLMQVEGYKNKLLMGKVCAASALIRKESRACHYRSDYPARDDQNWLKWVIAKLEGNEPQVWTEDIPIQKWKYRPEVK